MKNFFTGLIFLFSVYTYGQVEKDSTVTKYIEKQKEFVGLSNLNNIPDSIQTYLNAIKEYMANNEMNINDYWI